MPRAFLGLGATTYTAVTSAVLSPAPGVGGGALAMLAKCTLCIYRVHVRNRRGEGVAGLGFKRTQSPLSPGWVTSDSALNLPVKNKEQK